MMRETNRSEHVSIDIVHVDQTVYSIQGKLCPKSPFPSKCCIFKVPISLRRHKENAYVPNLVSLGPFHHGKENLKEMERVKMWYLHCLLDRSPTAAETSLDCFVKAIREMEPDLRKCYAEQISLSVDQFVEIMVVDGCFIIELFRKKAQKVPRDKDDPVFNMSWMYSALANDLLLLENQLPWPVLESLWDLTMTDDEPNTSSLIDLALDERTTSSLTDLALDERNTSSLTDLALNFFRRSMLTMSPYRPQSNIRFRNKHLLDFLRSSLLSSFSDTELQEPPVTQLDTELQEPPVTQPDRSRHKNKLNFMRSCVSFADTELQEPPGNEIPPVTQPDRSRHRNKLNFMRSCVSFANKELQEPPGNEILPVTQPKRSRHRNKLNFMRSCISIADKELQEPPGNEIPPVTQPDRSRHWNKLNFMRCCLCSSFAESKPERPLGIVIPCVTELLQAGVKFKRGSVNDMLNIKFNNGVMEIPPILIQDNAESLFRNLIAFEQCGPGCAHNITSYALLLDNLINSSKDVDILCERGIVLNYLSTEDIAGVFNRLYNDTGIRGFSYGDLCQKVNKHYKARCHRWQAILSRDYFNSSWSILSFLAAILILGLSFTQTLFSILSYKVSLQGP